MTKRDSSPTASRSSPSPRHPPPGSGALGSPPRGASLPSYILTTAPHKHSPLYSTIILIIMPKNIYVFLAEGFEETEAIATIDLLRRAGLPTHIVTIEDEPHVTGAHGIAVQADLSIREVYSADVRALVLPGGLPGVSNLDASPRLHELIQDAVAEGKILAAICAAPSIYGRLGLLEGKEAIAYPGFEGQLHGAKVSASPVVRSGNFITAKSAAYTFDFALALIEALESKEKADEVASAIVYHRP